MATIVRRGAFGCVLGLLLVMSAIRVAAAPGADGAWSPVKPWPLIPLHMVVMPDGRVLSFGTKADGTQTGNFIYDVWDPAGGFDAGHLTLANTTGTDIFCSSTLVLPQGGKVFIAGGDNWTGTGTTNTGNNNSNLFDYGSNTLARQSNMNRARWYSSSTVLLNGEVYTQGGSGGTDFPEVRSTDGTFRLLTGAATGALDFMYPRNFIAPDGRVFGFDSAGRMYYANTTGTGSITRVGQFSGPTGSDSSVAMFRPGRILQFGGNSNGAVVIDITGGSPVVTPTGSMSSQRRLVNATILPDGKVLATGGSPVWNDMTNANYSAEIWDPNTGVWTVGSRGVKARLYHSTAVLMPDASVLVAGGGAPGPQNNTNLEVYYPPYLYDAAGNLKPRPAIDSAPSVLDIGQTFAAHFSSAPVIHRVVMIKTTAVTHSFNMEQRFVELTFTSSGNRLMVQAPTRAADAPPGFYMLFLLDAAGTPSIARIVKVNVAPQPNPDLAPILADPGAQVGLRGVPVTLQLSASDPNGDVLGFGASGLPTGLSIDGATGLVSGTPTEPGLYNVVIAASDGVNSDVRNFVWTIAMGEPFTINPIPPPTPQLAGESVTFTAGVTGGTNVLYRWDFNDGTQATGYSADPTVTHSFTRPGIYYVTVTVIDASGLPQSTTLAQTVHLPQTANRPAVSSNIAYESRSGAGDRVWVVNQDNSSISVFDAASNAKLAEITVGAAPRALAIAPNGEVWVTSRQLARISVINPSTLTVRRTLKLPFASQPFGIAMAPTGGRAYVALEASGKLLAIDVATYKQLASVDVGANPRHVSVSSDGRKLYVSRFITPLQPGESTADVGTDVGGMATGGQIVVVDAATMLPQGTIVLRHSDKADAENQGRGVPNYIGAVALSPDGLSAWVPSKQDNIRRGSLRDGNNLNFQNTVRAIGSRIDLAAGAEDHASRLDFDNSSLASAAVFDPTGVYMFVALETSRQVAVVSAYDRWEIFRFDAGRAPQGLALSSDGRTLYVNNFMDRTVGVFDLTALLSSGTIDVPMRATLPTVAKDKLSAVVLQGKQLFYDARDSRLARDSYMSCASCHNDGDGDGRVWDLTGFGEGLRNTIALNGRAATAQGYLHWSNNFDELQDFEGQIRALSGGSGLMPDGLFQAGTRSRPLGDAKAGLSVDLDSLAAYVASLKTFASSPLRNADGSLSAAAVLGKDVFLAMNCAGCHGSVAFTSSGVANPQDIGTLKTSSGSRLGGALAGIDVPTLRDAWATAPYLHDGSAATLADAIRAHKDITVPDADLQNLVAYVSEIGGQETTAPTAEQDAGTGLQGEYFNNKELSGDAVLQLVETVNFDWSTGSPDDSVNADDFSARWTGTLEAAEPGSYQFQTNSNAGVRLWVNGIRVIDRWTAHTTRTHNSTKLTLLAGARYTIRMEYYEDTGPAVAQLRWKSPGMASFAAIPASRLYTH